jgi:two-component system, cell cycle sensor histidine kinase and response regulator CckA
MSETEHKRSTILVVDDTEEVLKVVTTILRANGFQVMSAHDGASAMQVVADHRGQIDLLLSDIDVPGTTGPQLGIDIKKSHPDMHVMLMSGLPDGALLVLNYGWAFIQKPFLVKKLIQMVSAVLDNPDKSQGSYGYNTRN